MRSAIKHPHRRLLAETLESRRLLAADPFGQNLLQPLDVTRDGNISALDALRIINALGFYAEGTGQVDPVLAQGNFIDVNGDGSGTALDALIVVNGLSAVTPLLAAVLPTDSAPGGSTNLDLVTNQYAVDLILTGTVPAGSAIELELQHAGATKTADIADRFQQGRASLSEADIDAIWGQPLADGDYLVSARIQGFADQISFPISVDRSPPMPRLVDGDLIRFAADSLRLEFADTVIPVSQQAADYAVDRIDADDPLLASVNVQGNTVQLRFEEVFADDDFELRYDAPLEDAAGNRRDISSVSFSVADPAGIALLSPADKESMVNVTRSVMVYFDEPVDAASVSADAFEVSAAGTPIPTNVRISTTEYFATLSFEQPLPASTQIRLLIDGDRISGRDGRALDADEDGEPGGIRTISFQTLPLSRLTGTNVFGFVRDSYSGHPLVGATIRVDAFPQANAVTDQDGRFELVDMPAPEFFVHVDGSTATHVNQAGSLVPLDPAVTTYPNVGKPFHSVAGQTTQLNHHGETFDVFLPPMALADVQSLQPNAATDVGFGDAGMAALQELFPNVQPSMFARMSVNFPANSAIDAAGNPVTQAAVIPVPPDRLPAPLPPDVETPLVVSIQAPGATQFDVPAPVTFPNLEAMPADTPAIVMSFNHSAGRWEPAAAARISDDGLSVETVPGAGVRAPGWHYICFCVLVAGTVERPIFDQSTGSTVLGIPIENPAAVTKEEVESIKDRAGVALRNLDNDRVIRLQTEVDGTFSVLLPPATPFELSAYDPLSNLAAEQSFTTADRVTIAQAPNRAAMLTMPRQDLGRVLVGTASIQDTDEEGLSDVAEFVVGTFLDQVDSDTDGTSDYDEVRIGSDPTGGAALLFGLASSLQLFPTSDTNGVIRSATGGAVVISEHPQDPSRTIAWTVINPYDFDLVTTFQLTPLPAQLVSVDITDPLAPFVIHRHSLPDETRTGQTTSLALDETTNRLVVGGSVPHMYVFDVSSPIAPRLLLNTDVSAVQFVIDGDKIYSIHVADPRLPGGGRIAAINVSDLQTGELIQQQRILAPFNDSPFVGAIAIGNGAVYVALSDLASNRVITRVDRFQINPNGTLADSPISAEHVTDITFFANLSLAVDGDLIYLAQLNVSSVGGGFAVLRDTGTELVFIGDPSTISTTIYGIAVDRTGHLVFGDQLVLQTYDVTDPAVTDQFIAAPAVPVSAARGFALAGGRAYVTSVNDPDLYVVNYLSTSPESVAPNLFISPSSPDADPLTDGFQVIEGRGLDINLSITDQSPIRSVRLFVEDVMVARQSVSPFTFNIRTDRTWVSRGVTEVRVEATDANGNVGISNRIEIETIPDIEPPQIRMITPAANSNAGRLLEEVAIVFSEAIDQNAVVPQADSIKLRSVDADNLIPVTIRRVENTLHLTFEPLADGEYELLIDADRVTDLAANPLQLDGSGMLQHRFTVGQRELRWAASSGGDFHDPGNWDLGVTPRAYDDVVVDFDTIPDGVNLIIRGNVAFGSLRSDIPIQIVDASIESTGPIYANGGITISDSQVMGGSLETDDASGIDIAGQWAWFSGTSWESAVRLNTPGQQVTVSGDLIIRDTVDIGGDSTLELSGYERHELLIGGSGSIRFGDDGEPGYLSLTPLTSNDPSAPQFESLRIGPDITLEGAKGHIRRSTTTGLMDVVNEGTLRATAAVGAESPLVFSGLAFDGISKLANLGLITVDPLARFQGGRLLENVGHIEVAGVLDSLAHDSIGGSILLQPTGIIEGGVSGRLNSAAFRLGSASQLTIIVDPASEGLFGYLRIYDEGEGVDAVQLLGTLAFQVQNGSQIGAGRAAYLIDWGYRVHTVDIQATPSGLDDDPLAQLELVEEFENLKVIARPR